MDEVALTSAEILARYSDLAHADIGHFLKIDTDGKWKVDLLKAKQLGKLHTLKKIRQSGDRVEIEMHSPIPALDKLAQYRGLLKDTQPSRKVYEFHILGGDDDDRGGDESGQTPGDSTPGEVLEEPGHP